MPSASIPRPQFFEGYYRDGDLVITIGASRLQSRLPQTRQTTRSRHTFHWKCRDSYYVKTATGFNSVAFEVEGKRIEYRLDGKTSSISHRTIIAMISNTIALIGLIRPQPDDPEQMWRVILHLAETSTPKLKFTVNERTNLQ